MEKFGMPVGFLTFLHEVGINVGEHIIKVLFNAFSDRLKERKNFDTTEIINRFLYVFLNEAARCLDKK